MMIRATVIIPTFRDWDGIQRCLDALALQTVSPSEFEIIVANNNRDDVVPDSLSLPPNARVVWESKPGSYAARNAALQVAQGDAVFFTDSDCIPEPDWIANGLDPLENHPDITRFGGAVKLFPAKKDWTTPELYDRVFNLRQERYVVHGYAATANLLVRRSVFEAVGPFNAELMSSGDKEWNQRAEKAGYPILYLPNMCVRHPARDSFAAHAKKRGRVAEGKFIMKNRDKLKSYVSPLKYIFPSVRNAYRICSEPNLVLFQRLALLEFDYRLRLHEAGVLFKLRYLGGPQGRRQ
ncbi:hypothetical protein SAMN04488515_3290 [Cognatiyoonia koreensis]|uniref:Glycosyltransferase 2-like domain-containing protein n=1 Tax=Cognatiyoonia koreensis TaxID=364200 RepID=A0A1I0RUW5_9RHOB|nr:glycosyltransferase family A protein [Cognatiyoonia koreensis]SEW45135.1 hypothetical protein SAMN04488515_3290 [Cognatiyoonia koreensis]